MMMEAQKLTNLAIVFISLAIVLPRILPLLPTFSFWLILLTLTIAWFLIEVKLNWKNRIRIKKALAIGLFLMIFDFIIENLGAVGFFLGQWRSFYSLYFVLYVPIEIIFVTLLGGTAWALYLPKKFNIFYSLGDILLFSTYGMIGEYILVANGIMQYRVKWVPYVFIGYLITWIILHILAYRVVKVSS